MGVDGIIIRHQSPGAPHFLSRHVKAFVINAGDGAHEHPTQALLDAFTLQRKLGSLEGKRMLNCRRHRPLPGRPLEPALLHEAGS